MHSASIQQLFIDAAAAIDAAHDHLSVDSIHTVEETRRDLALAFQKFDILLAALQQLPMDAAKTYHPALTHLVTSLEEFQNATLATNAEIKQELNTANQHARAFNAYLTTSKG